MRKTIVISAVNLVEAGTLAILRDCLSFLSQNAVEQNLRVVAIVHKRSLADFPNIEYIEDQWPKKRWINRLWYEYISLKSISKEIGHVTLWFSLHDTSPSVYADRRAVYCHNSFSFYKWSVRDLLFAPKIAMFAIFTKFIYQTNIHKNNFLVVQQEWFRKGLSSMFSIDKHKIIVYPPLVERTINSLDTTERNNARYQFIFAGSPNSHKNFEIICKAVEILLNKKIVDFQVVLTLKGTENKYARWIYENWGHLANINFLGFVTRQQLEDLYRESQCLIFPSKVESWGLPISEFKQYDKPMLLADLPYTHETAAGAQQTAYFNPEDANQLATLMKALIEKDRSCLKPSPKIDYYEPTVENWRQLFDKLMNAN